MSSVTLGGNPVKVAGNFPKTGDTAPHCIQLTDYEGREVLTVPDG